MMVKMLNLTPHEIILMRESETGEVTGFTGFGRAAQAAQYKVFKKIPSSGVVRASQRDTPAGSLLLEGDVKVELISTQFGELSGLPDPEAGTFFIVSAVAAQAARFSGRSTEDLLLVADTVRDEDGKILGCQKFARV